jgi:ABC-type multidrug transport system permease subunit
MGSLFFITLSSAMMSMLPTILTFPLERLVFLKEENSRMYTLAAYFGARVLIDCLFNIMLSVMSCSIIYWIIGYNDTTTEIVSFFFYVQTLLFLIGWAIGLMIGSLFADIVAAVGFAAVFFAPFIVYGGYF